MKLIQTNADFNRKDLCMCSTLVWSADGSITEDT